MSEDEVILDPDVWPKDAKTLRDLMEKLMESSDWINLKVEETIRRNPGLHYPDGRWALGMLSLMVTADFLAWAFDRPELGYRVDNLDPGDPRAGADGFS